MRGSHEAKMCDGAQSVNHFIGTVKECVKCGKEKPLDDFPKRTDTKNGYRNECRVCLSKINRLRYLLNAEEVKAKQREWNAKNKDKKKQAGRKWYLNNPDKVRESRRNRSAQQKEADIKRLKKWNEEHPERGAERSKRWRINHPEKAKQVAREGGRKIRATPNGRLNGVMSSAIRRSLRGAKSFRHWESFIGYTIDELKRHLEKQFDNNMTWENHGQLWEIDHKIPMSIFNFTTTDHIDFKRCWALKNLRPLEKSANRQKSCKLNKTFQPSLAL